MTSITSAALEKKEKESVTAKQTEFASAASSSTSALPSHLYLSQSTSDNGGVSLHTSRSIAQGETVFSELPLIVVPPFVELPHANAAMSSKSTQSPQPITTWSSLTSSLTRLGLTSNEIEPLVAYRGFVIVYLVLCRHGSSRATSTSGSDSQSDHILHDTKDRLLSLYNPLTLQSNHTKFLRLQTSLSAALRSESGFKTALNIMMCVARQCEVMLELPISSSLLNNNASHLLTLLTSPSFPSDLLNFSYIYNTNNIDCVHIPQIQTAKGAMNIESVTAVYEVFSRMNHECRSNCIHELMETKQGEEEAEESNQAAVSIKWSDATPKRLYEMRKNQSAATSSVTNITTSPFLRLIRSLYPISPNTPLTISYLSSQILIQSTPRRQEYLAQHWDFICRCVTCQEKDQARVMLCWKCTKEEDGNGGGRVTVKMMLDDHTITSPQDLPFLLDTTCSCILTSDETNTLLNDEQLLLDAFTELRASIPTSPAPLALATSYGVSLKLKNILSDQHYLRYEYHQLMCDLFGWLTKRLDELDACKRIVWYLERVLTLRSEEEVAPSNFFSSSSSNYTQSSLLIDITSSNYITPRKRIASLYLCTELLDSYSRLSDLSWNLSLMQDDRTLRDTLMQRSIYFQICTHLVTKVVCQPTSQKVREVRCMLKERYQEAIRLGVDIGRIVEGVESEIGIDGKVEEHKEEGKESTSTTSSAPTSTPPISSSITPSSTRCNSSCCPSLSSTSTTATLICSRCRTVRYCSVACQKLDWKRHRCECKPITKSST